MDVWVAFLTARLDEDEATAQYAGPALIAWFTFYGSDGRLLYTTVAATSGEVQDVWVADGKVLPKPASMRVVYDPARALREVKAKRDRLALYLDAKEALAAALRSAPAESPATRHSYVRERINVNQASGRFTAMEASLRLDADVYSTHPDYPGQTALTSPPAV